MVVESCCKCDLCATYYECMAQDYSKALPAYTEVGFTVVNQVGQCWCESALAGGFIGVELGWAVVGCDRLRVNRLGVKLEIELPAGCS